MFELSDLELLKVVDDAEEFWRDGRVTDPAANLRLAMLHLGSIAAELDLDDSVNEDSLSSLRAYVYAAARDRGFCRYEVESALLDVQEDEDSMPWRGPATAVPVQWFTWLSMDLGLLVSDARSPLSSEVWLASMARVITVSASWERFERVSA